MYAVREEASCSRQISIKRQYRTDGLVTTSFSDPVDELGDALSRRIAQVLDALRPLAQCVHRRSDESIKMSIQEEWLFLKTVQRGGQAAENAFVAVLA